MFLKLFFFKNHKQTFVLLNINRKFYFSKSQEFVFSLKNIKSTKNKNLFVVVVFFRKISILFWDSSSPVLYNVSYRIGTDASTEHWEHTEHPS